MSPAGLGVLQEELEGVAGEKEARNTLLSLDTTATQLRISRRKWVDGYVISL